MRNGRSLSNHLDETVSQKPDSTLARLIGLVNEHDQMMRTKICLIASGNLISPVQRRFLQSDLLSRAAEGKLGQRLFPGLQYFDEIEAIGEEVVSRMFGGCAVDLRPISGSQANLAVLSALTRPGDTILTVSLKHGGHVSQSGKVYADLLGVRRTYIPWDEVACDISYDALEQMASEVSPTVIVVGGSVMIYPPNLERIVAIARRAGAKTIYDMSHNAAFVLTGLHSNPMVEGIDVATFTTCKTIPGPSHAVIVSDPKNISQIGNTIFPGLVSGGHLNELVGAVAAICELEAFGRSYTSAIVRNAQTLGDTLLSAGLRIVRDPNRRVTETHQILIDCRQYGGGQRVENILENGGILSNRNMLWWDRSYQNPSGVRLGLQEVTRLGMGKDEMLRIANWVVELLAGRSTAEIAVEIQKFREPFQEPVYCLDEF